ncbi:MAG: aromatic ring-hydroxylating dioxygenase subunit alpha [Pseudomonadota bacterium]
MIHDRWYAILESTEVRRGQALGVRRLGHDLVVWRGEQGSVGCMEDRCPHRGAALSTGEVHDSHVACPFHGFQFDAEGRARHVPAMGRGAEPPAHVRGVAWPLREAHGFLWAWYGEAREDLPPLPFFTDLADPSWRWASARDPWAVHYSRAVENQLDVVHLPFVHRTTIGRGHRTVVDGPGVKTEGDDLFLWVHNRTDDGAPARRAEEFSATTGRPQLHFRHPGIWQNLISDDIRVFISFTPVDDEHTVLYLRFYQRQLTWPLLGALYAWLGILMSRVIAAQDKRVVLTQRPVRSQLRMDEKLIPQDRPLVEFRRRQEELARPDSPR